MLGRCWCGGQVRYEFGYCNRHGLWCQFGHPVSDEHTRAFERRGVVTAPQRLTGLPDPDTPP
jgi:hypothetical protein